MRFISPLLRRSLYPVAHHAGWLDHMMPPAGYAVVSYHGVVPSDHPTLDPFLDGNLVPPEVFRRQLRFLKDHYRVIHPDEFRARIEQSKPLPPRSVLLTCDDGLLNTLTDMLPILLSENVPCLFFVTGASCMDDPAMLWYEELYHLMRIEALTESELKFLPEEESRPARNSPSNFSGLWWNTVKRASRLTEHIRADWIRGLRRYRGLTQILRSASSSEKSSSEKRFRLLNIDELRRLSAAGMTIGAHTMSHPVLSLCSDDEVRREIQGSKAVIERAIGRAVWAFAYPFGNPATMGQREIRLAREAGFSCAFLNVEHWAGEAPDSLAIPRCHVTVETTLPEFAAHLSGLHRRLQRALGG
ncbi:MAG: polysaccharide deacetylase family protein [Candidatus Sulfotelmatobacter sp.]